jgi:tryptophan-rich sensory protein
LIHAVAAGSAAGYSESSLSVNFPAHSRVDGIAAAMLVPYLLWVACATAVAWQIWVLNT